MMNEEQRRRIARKFLEKNFGKRGYTYLKEFNIRIPLHDNFELWKAWESATPGDNQARAFEVIFAPYISTSKQKFIAVSDSKEELNEIVHQVFDKERIRLGLLEYDKQDGYYVVYD